MSEKIERKFKDTCSKAVEPEKIQKLPEISVSLSDLIACESVNISAFLVFFRFSGLLVNLKRTLLNMSKIVKR